MAYVFICDLCGKKIEPGWDESTVYKIKRKRSSDVSFIWKTIDAHDKCVNALLKEKEKHMSPPNIENSIQDE